MSIHFIIEIATSGPTAADWATVNGRAEKIGPGAYAASCAQLGQGMFWGTAYIDDPHLLFAHAASDLIDRLFLEELATLESNPTHSVEVRVKKPGVARYFNDLIMNWKANGGKNKRGDVPKNFEVWDRFNNLCSLGSITFRGVEGTAEEKALAPLHDLALRRKQRIKRPSPSDGVTVLSSGTE